MWLQCEQISETDDEEGRKKTHCGYIPGSGNSTANAVAAANIVALHIRLTHPDDAIGSRFSPACARLDWSSKKKKKKKD